LIVTIIFIGEDGEPVQIRFQKNADLDQSHRYGRWNVKTNEIDLNDNGWRVFETYRNQVRKLKPLLEQLEKFEA
jgi:hypothetical protein